MRSTSLLVITVLCFDVNGLDAPCFFLSNEARVEIPCFPAEWLDNRGGSFNGTPQWLPLDGNVAETRGCNEASMPKPKASDQHQNVVAVAPRGGCSFATKAINAMRLGAIGLIIVNFDAQDMIPMGAPPSDGLQLSQFSAVMVPSDWLPREVTASWSTLGDDSSKLGDSIVGFNHEPRNLSEALPSSSMLAAIAAELSREGRNEDALLQLDAAVV